jgi:hypothetical protein
MSFELDLRGRPFKGAAPLESLGLVLAHLEGCPRAWNEGYIAIPSSVNQLMPASVTAWMAFFQRVPNAELAVFRLYEETGWITGYYDPRCSYVEDFEKLLSVRSLKKLVKVFAQAALESKAA